MDNSAANKLMSTVLFVLVVFLLQGTSIGYEIWQENILSNVLGESMIDSVKVRGEEGYFYFRKGIRNHLNLFVEHFFEYENFTTSFGVLINYNNHFGLSS